MWLINTVSFTLEEFYGSAIRPYAILSHTWDSEEVSFKDMQDLAGAKRKRGFIKIKYACEQARKDYLGYVWVDTCCIDKSSSSELQEAINSMFTWYKDAVTCYVYLADMLGSCPYIDDEYVGRGLEGVLLLFCDDKEEASFWHRAFTQCRWFTRGWTLQELIAPKELHFFGYAWNYIGSKSGLKQLIANTTRVDASILEHEVSLSSVSVAKRMSWAAHRQTSRIEDQAYSMMGIFGVNIPMLYGEGRGAFRRLQEEIMKLSSDHSIFAWERRAADSSLLAESPADFAGAHGIVNWGRPGRFDVTNRGVRIELPLIKPKLSGGHDHLAVLNCRYEDNMYHTLALRLHRYQDHDEYHVRTFKDSEVDSFKDDLGSTRLEPVHLRDVRTAPSSVLEITRKFEKYTKAVTFYIQVVTTPDQYGRRVVIKYYYPDLKWDQKQLRLRVDGGSRARAGVRIVCPSSISFNLVFGFDVVRERDNQTNLIHHRRLPGIAVQSYGRYQVPTGLQSFCESWRPCNHTIQCEDPIRQGCPSMQTSVSAFGGPGTETLVADMKVEEAFGDEVFRVTVTVGERSIETYQD